MPAELIFFPKNLDIEKIVRDNPPKHKVDPIVFLRITSAIYEKMASSFKKGKGKFFVELYSVELRKIHRKYNDHIRYLEKCKIIEVDHSYEKGNKCKGYRICPYYYESGIQSISINQSSRKWKGYSELIGVYKDLADKFEYIEVDFDSVMLELDQLKKEDFNRYIRYYIYLQKFKYKNLHFKKDDYGRFHTTLTSCPKELRKYLLINNEPLCELDIKSTQPLLLIYVLNGLNENSIHIKSKVKDCDYEKIKMLAKLYSKNEFQDLIDFYHHVKEGEIYERIRELYNNLYNERISRKEIKGLLLSYINDDHKYNGIVKGLRNLMELYYPRINSLLLSLKSKDHKIVAHTLQKIESDLVIKNICKSILKTHPSIPLFTIHDCILTTTSKIDLIRPIFEETLAKTFGFTPNISQKTYSSTVNKDAA